MNRACLAWRLVLHHLPILDHLHRWQSDFPAGIQLAYSQYIGMNTYLSQVQMVDEVSCIGYSFQNVNSVVGERLSQSRRQIWHANHAIFWW